MGHADYFELGDHNAVCFECGKKFKASELIKHWKGYYVCRAHWEPRHPQDFVRAPQPERIPAWTQPQPADTFTLVASVWDGGAAIAGLAIAGVAITGTGNGV